ncbi:Serine/threonine protein kinase [Handroanthus impetiginosus]|uniref:non-specific serine/threonine protein kinase n=1 Tax=Handroanthus impetiginosus TaxID=429701 RepID=A0A2G9H3F5_9LAMI|nr:Serine/threonine protein kinase [Handroanthus impetiginosus]
MWTLTSKFILIDIASILYCFLVIVEGAKLQTFTAEYGPFNETYYDILEVIWPATISSGALQVTPDAASSDFKLSNKSARVLLNQRFKLWEEHASQPQLASFNTSFLFNVFRPFNDTAAEGLAFMIAPNLLLPPGSMGQFLGLTNTMGDTSDTANRFVAVELDTSRQCFDPDNNHVGIDVNNIKSIKTESLAPHNITIAPIGMAKFYNVWVDYDGLNMVIDVYIAEQPEITSPTPPKPGSPILSADLDLREHVNQYAYLGFSASTGNASQLNRVLMWNLTVQHFSDSGKELDKWMKIMLGAGLAVLVLVLVFAVGFGYRYRKLRTVAPSSNLVGALQRLPATPREFKFRDLKKATSRFDEKNKLGQGGFGMVYRGMLVKENMEIAVKLFSRENIKGQHDFLSELTIINRLRHKHLVKLLGWCHKKGKLLLVYEYMPNGSLDKHLFIGPNKEPLEWNLRYKIISGLALALHYLHNEYDQKVVHRDLKASNIMLDSDFNARLGDFGLARALDNGRTSYAEAEGVLGTMGYIAPECFLTGKATRQSDIYAFGAVLLEVICGQRPGTRIAGFQFLVDWVWLLHRDGKLLEVVDQRLGDNYIVEEANRLLLLGLACSHPSASERPRTQSILQMISGAMPVPYVPPFKPAFVWPAGEPMDMDSVNTVSITTSDSVSEWSPKNLSSENSAGHTDSLV